MKLILVIVAAIAVITMTACSSEKNTAERKLYKPPATVDETTLTDTQYETNTEHDSSTDPEQVISADTIAVSNEPAITEAVTVYTETDASNSSTPPTSAEIPATQKVPNKPVIPSNTLPDLDSDTTAAKKETSIATEPSPVSQLSIKDIMEMCVRIAENMGYSRDTTFTPENSAWWNPVTVSVKDTKQNIERTLSEYIRFHTPDNLTAYGYDTITCFNIYAEKQEEGVYRIYFLFA